MFKPLLEVLDRIASALETLAETRDDYLKKQRRQQVVKGGPVAWGYQGTPKVYEVDEEKEWLSQQPQEIQAEYRKVQQR